MSQNQLVFQLTNQNVDKPVTPRPLVLSFAEENKSLRSFDLIENNEPVKRNVSQTFNFDGLGIEFIKSSPDKPRPVADGTPPRLITLSFKNNDEPFVEVQSSSTGAIPKILKLQTSPRAAIFPKQATPTAEVKVLSFKSAIDVLNGGIPLGAVDKSTETPASVENSCEAGLGAIPKLVKTNTSQVPVNPTSDPPAVLSFKTLQPIFIDGLKPSNVPPPVTDEDMEIIKRFMTEENVEPVSCYNQLLAANGSELVVNTEEFVCSICEIFINRGEGIVLKGCLHNFCRLCLIDEIKSNHNDVGEVKCPFKIINCDVMLDYEEIKAMLGDSYAEFADKVAQMLDEKIRSSETTDYDLLPMLLHDDNNDYIENFKEFECLVCFCDVAVGDGVILKNCLHQFCKDCVVNTIRHSDESEVKCPYIDDENRSCSFTIQDREIRGLSPAEVFDKHLEKSLKMYEGSSESAYHCKSPDCRGFIEVDRNVRGFTCQVCGLINCISCKAIHTGKNCQEYQDEINPNAKHERDNLESENAIKSLIASGEAMWCPKCGISVMKKDGCDYITCTACKLGICWVTRKPRKPLTKDSGEIIDGCHCKENGTPCHPKCGNCH